MSQQVINFNVGHAENKWQKTLLEKKEAEIADITLTKAQHIHKLLQKEGFSNKAIKENIDIFEDVPAYVRRNMSIKLENKAVESNLSKFTLETDDDKQPVFRENNAYLDQKVD